MKKNKLIIIFFVVAVIVRLFFFVLAYLKLPIAVDESYVGLMAMHVLKGEFPVVYWGQSYMGTQESYLAAPLVYLMGGSPIPVRIFPFIFSILFIYFSYKLARSIYNENVGFITLLLLVVPVPYLSIASAVVQPDTYVAIATFGLIALLITFGLVFKENTKKRLLKYFFLGFILGFGFWMHIIIASYILVVLFFLFLKDKFIIFKKEFWIMIFAFVLGCLPLLWYNLTHNFNTFRDVAGAASFHQMLHNLKILFEMTLHYLFGLKIMLCADTEYYMNLPQILYLSTGIILVSLVFLTIIVKFKNIWRLCYLSLRGTDGTSMLVVMGIVAIITFCRSDRANSSSVRYILPIMSVLPILWAYGLWKIKTFSKVLFYVCLFVVFSANLWGNFLLVKALNDPNLVSEKLALHDMKPLINFLKENNIKYTYANYCISYNLSYVTNEEIICATPYNERFMDYEVPFQSEVREADNVAYIMHKTLGVKPADFENMLNSIGGNYNKKNLDSYTVFYSFEPPYEANRLLKDIPRNNWKTSSNFLAEDTWKAIDGDVLTRWGSGAPQQPGMYFDVDLGSIYKITKIRFDLGRFVTDYPRAYKIEISEDNQNWAEVLLVPDNNGGLFWEGSHPRFLVKGDFFTASFPPQEARYIKITQLGADSRFDWSIVEVYVYSKATKNSQYR